MAAAHAGRRLAAADDETPAGPPSSEQRPQFNLSSGAASVAPFVSVVLCFVLLCTYCRCARQRATPGVRRRVVRELAPGAAGGVLLRSVVGAALPPPAVPYASAAKKGRADDCAVCLEAFGDDDGVRVVPTCGHLFHEACIDPWLQVRRSCPVCRCPVAFYYGDRARGAAVAMAAGGDSGDQEVILEQVVAIVEAIRDGQVEEEAAAVAAPASAGRDEG